MWRGERWRCLEEGVGEGAGAPRGGASAAGGAHCGSSGSAAGPGKSPRAVDNQPPETCPGSRRARPSCQVVKPGSAGEKKEFRLTQRRRRWWPCWGQRAADSEIQGRWQMAGSECNEVWWSVGERRKGSVQRGLTMIFGRERSSLQGPTGCTRGSRTQKKHFSNALKCVWMISDRILSSLLFTWRLFYFF